MSLAQRFGAHENTSGDLTSSLGNSGTATDTLTVNDPMTAAISGTIFDDANGNGANDGEPGLSGVTVYLDLNTNGALDGGEPSVLSVTGGNYSFTGLKEGTYTVRIVVPAGYSVTAPGGAQHTGHTLVCADCRKHRFWLATSERLHW